MVITKYDKWSFGRVWLKGSRRYLSSRCIYTNGCQRFFCRWYGNYIEVRRGVQEWYTVEEY